MQREAERKEEKEGVVRSREEGGEGGCGERQRGRRVW